MILAMLGMILFTKLTPQADYLGNVLPGLVVTGLGLGLILAPATASATAGIARGDAGAAAALVNTTQQVGASVGTALLNTIAVSGDRAQLRRAARLSPRRARDWATLHGYAGRRSGGRRGSSASARSSRSPCSSRACPSSRANSSRCTDGPRTP